MQQQQFEQQYIEEKQHSLQQKQQQQPANHPAAADGSAAVRMAEAHVAPVVAAASSSSYRCSFQFTPNNGRSAKPQQLKNKHYDFFIQLKTPEMKQHGVGPAFLCMGSEEECKDIEGRFSAPTSWEEVQKLIRENKPKFGTEKMLEKLVQLHNSFSVQ